MGSGPAGLSAALTAAREGHKVTVFERGPRIGGCLVLSSVFSPMYERLIKYYKAVLPKYPNIDIRCNKKVTAEFVKKCAPEVVIVAVGGECIDGDMPGTDGKNVVRSHDFLELLNGRPPQKPGIVNKVLWNAGYVFLHFIYTPKLINFALSCPPLACRQEGRHHRRQSARLRDGHEADRRLAQDEHLRGREDRLRRRLQRALHSAQHLQDRRRRGNARESRVVSITDSGVYAVNENGQEDFYRANTVAVTLGFRRTGSCTSRSRTLRRRSS
ncbi:MAG: NAD(P)-binding protein [Oscillospiraceae bacterium]